MPITEICVQVVNKKTKLFCNENFQNNYAQFCILKHTKFTIIKSYEFLEYANYALSDGKKCQENKTE